jgi:hypothetical protein
LIVQIMKMRQVSATGASLRRITLPGEGANAESVTQCRHGVASLRSRQSLEETPMHALSEPPVSPAPVGGFPVPAPALDQRRVVIRLRDGETILVGGAPSYERALVLAQKTIAQLGDVREGEWPMLGDRFVNPDAIVSVDVLRWT